MKKDRRRMRRRKKKRSQRKNRGGEVRYLEQIGGGGKCMERE